MPHIVKSSYSPPAWLRNCHIQTIYGGYLRPGPHVSYQRERINTPDHDFLDLDWAITDPASKNLVILSHGLSGCSTQPYILGMAKAFNQRGWNALAWNFRGCSGEVNLTPISYHMGWTFDLDVVIQHAISLGQYDQIVLIGFSLGGNVTLKYVGERAADLHPIIKKAIAFSVPVDVPSCVAIVEDKRRWIYFKPMMYELKQRLLQKAQRLPNFDIDIKRLMQVHTWKEFDQLHVVPVFGFKSPEDYWNQSGSKPFLQNVTIPTLLINAKDDPLLSRNCYPVEIAQKTAQFHLEIPDYGGHVGFVAVNKAREFWSETRAIEFAEASLKP